VEFVDIAGLVAGASKAKDWETSSSPTSASATPSPTWCAASRTRNVIHVAGKVDPISDIETINTELALADLAAVEKAYSRYGKVARTGGDKEAQRIVAVLDKIRPVLDEARPARSVQLSKESRRC